MTAGPIMRKSVEKGMKENCMGGPMRFLLRKKPAGNPA